MKEIFIGTSINVDDVSLPDLLSYKRVSKQDKFEFSFKFSCQSGLPKVATRSIRHTNKTLFSSIFGSRRP